jgi:hypothetical protein
MKRLVLFLLALFLVVSPIACGGSGEASTGTTRASDTAGAGEAVTTATTSAPQTTVSTEASIPEDVAYTNVLFMGAPDEDFSDGQPAWAITHLLITLDPAKQEIRFTQFPYNLMVDVDTEAGVQTMPLQMVSGEYGEDKAVETLEQNFGVTIDQWVVMNLNGVAHAVDTLGGVEIDIKSLSINEVGPDVAGQLMTGFEWQDVPQTGLQVLSGVQAAAYIEDNVPQSDDDPVTEEEMSFRDHHENLVRAVLASLKTLSVNGGGFMAGLAALAGNYSTSIPDSDWPAIAGTIVYCLENDPQFLFVPKEIALVGEFGNNIAYDRTVDVPAVQGFVLAE